MNDAEVITQEPNEEPTAESVLDAAINELNSSQPEATIDRAAEHVVRTIWNTKGKIDQGSMTEKRYQEIIDEIVTLLREKRIVFKKDGQETELDLTDAVIGGLLGTKTFTTPKFKRDMGEWLEENPD